MIIGTHFLVYSRHPEKDRAFLRDILGLEYVDAGGGWLIMELPPSEVAVHPGEPEGHELYLLTDDVHREVAALTKKRVPCTPVHEESWGYRTVITLPGGGLLGMYQPKHPLALKPAKRPRKAASRRARRPSRGA